MKLMKNPRALTLAALSLSGAACAQTSSVTLFGEIDMNIGRFKGSNTGVAVGDRSITKQDSGSLANSFWGIRGSEDLGGGISASFSLESFIRTDTGEIGRADATQTAFGSVAADPFFSKSAWVALDSRSWGRLRLGQQVTAIWLTSIQSNAFGASSDFSPINMLMFFNVPAILSGGNRWSNTISYDSPNLGGFAFSLQDSLGEGKGRNLGGRVAYTDGPFAAALAYSDVRKDPTTFADGTTRSNTRNALLALSYNLQSVHLFAHLGRVKTDGSNSRSTADDNITHSLWDISALVPVGAGRFMIGYGQRKGNEVFPTSQRKLFSFGYAYALSRRTDLYAMLRYDKTRAQGTPTTAEGASYALGVRHSF
jgi:predicted porin